AAAEIGLVPVAAARILGHQPIQRRERAREIAGLIVGLRELVEDAVVAGVIRIRAQQALVSGDRAAVLPRARRVGAPFARSLHLEVAEAPHRLGPQAVARRRVEKPAVRLDRGGAAGLDGRVALDRDLLFLEAGERRRRFGLARAART